MCPENCSKCCDNFLAVSQKEIDRIKQYIKDHKIVVHNPNTILGPYQNICPFLNKNGKCSIYPVRPEICAYYFCEDELKPKVFHHKNKHIINMLLTFNPNAFTPQDTPDVSELDQIYQAKKESIWKKLL